MKNNIIVNAQTINSSGGLEILNQLIEAIEKYSEDLVFIFFINPNLKLNHKTNNTIIIKDTLSCIEKYIPFCYRYNFKRRKKILSMQPRAIISLGNINLTCNKDIPNFIYFHQALALSKLNWSLLKKAEKKLWFYETIYPYLVKVGFNYKTEIIVQLEATKIAFSNKFNFDNNKIHVINPSVSIPNNLTKEETIFFDQECINYIYPSTPFKYKNHKTIIDALINVAKTTNKKIYLHLTCSQKALGKIKIDSDNFKIIYWGYLSHEKIQTMYLQSNALLFPSLVESYGLPLIEAATLGIPIIVSNLDYAREILNTYEGVSFVNPLNSYEWAEKILLNINIQKSNYTPLHISEDRSWKLLFNIIKEKINNQCLKIKPY